MSGWHAEIFQQHDMLHLDVWEVKPFFTESVNCQLAEQAGLHHQFVDSKLGNTCKM